MSVLIKGMQMPSDCGECPLSIYHERTGKTWCRPADGILAENYNPIDFYGRPDWCPLAELPEKHGRLIDEDDIDVPSLDTVHDQVLVYGAIREASTIIGAEE